LLEPRRGALSRSRAAPAKRLRAAWQRGAGCLPVAIDAHMGGSQLTVSTVRGCTGLDRLERAAFWRRWPSHPIPARSPAAAVKRDRPRKNRGSPRIWQVAPTSNGRLVTTRLAATEPHGITKDRHRRTSGLTPLYLATFHGLPRTPGTGHSPPWRAATWSGAGRACPSRTTENTTRRRFHTGRGHDSDQRRGGLSDG
jgi:hypothetical protein